MTCLCKRLISNNLNKGFFIFSFALWLGEDPSATARKSESGVAVRAVCKPCLLFFYFHRSPTKRRDKCARYQMHPLLGRNTSEQQLIMPCLNFQCLGSASNGLISMEIIATLDHRACISAHTKVSIFLYRACAESLTTSSIPLLGDTAG